MALFILKSFYFTSWRHTHWSMSGFNKVPKVKLKPQTHFSPLCELIGKYCLGWKLLHTPYTSLQCSSQKNRFQRQTSFPGKKSDCTSGGLNKLLGSCLHGELSEEILTQKNTNTTLLFVQSGRPKSHEVTILKARLSSKSNVSGPDFGTWCCVVRYQHSPITCPQTQL